MPSAEPTIASTAIRPMISWVFSRMTPSESAIWRTGLATASVSASSIW